MKTVSPKTQYITAPILRKTKRDLQPVGAKILIEEQVFQPEDSPKIDGFVTTKPKASPRPDPQVGAKMKLFEFPDVAYGPIKNKLHLPTPQAVEASPRENSKYHIDPQQQQQDPLTQWKPSVQVQHHFIPGVARLPNGSPSGPMNATNYSNGSGNTNQKFGLTQSMSTTQDVEYTPIKPQKQIFEQDSNIYLSPSPQKRPPSEEGKALGMSSSRNIDRSKLLNHLNSRDVIKATNFTMQQVANQTFQSGHSTARKRKTKQQQHSYDIAHVLMGNQNLLNVSKDQREQDQQKKKGQLNEGDQGLRSGAYQFKFPAAAIQNTVVELRGCESNQGGRESEFMSIEQYQKVIQETEILMQEEEAKRSRIAINPGMLDIDTTRSHGKLPGVSSPKTSKLKNANQKDMPSSAGRLLETTYYSYMNTDEASKQEASTKIAKAHIFPKTSKSRQKYQSALANLMQDQYTPVFKPSPVISYPMEDINQNGLPSNLPQIIAYHTTEQLQSPIFQEIQNAYSYVDPNHPSPGFKFLNPNCPISSKKSPTKALGLLRGLKKNLKLIKQENQRERTQVKMQKIYEKLKITVDPIVEASNSKAQMNQSVHLSQRQGEEATLNSLEQKLKEINMIDLDTHLIQLQSISPHPHKSSFSKRQTYNPYFQALNTSKWQNQSVSVQEGSSIPGQFRYFSPQPISTSVGQQEQLPLIGNQPKLPQCILPSKATSVLKNSIPKKQLLANYRQQIAKYMVGNSLKQESSLPDSVYRIDLSKLNVSSGVKGIEAQSNTQQQKGKALLKRKSLVVPNLSTLHKQRHSIGASKLLDQSLDSKLIEGPSTSSNNLDSSFQQHSRLNQYKEERTRQPGSPIFSHKKEHSVNLHQQMLTNQLTESPEHTQEQVSSGYVRRQQFII